MKQDSLGRKQIAALGAIDGVSHTGRICGWNALVCFVLVRLVRPQRDGKRTNEIESRGPVNEEEEQRRQLNARRQRFSGAGGLNSARMSRDWRDRGGAGVEGDWERSGGEVKKRATI